MAYWVYENWEEPYPKGKARIHRGCCRWCNDGQGLKQPKGIKNGRWREGGSSIPPSTKLRPSRNKSVDRFRPASRSVAIRDRTVAARHYRAARRGRG